MKKSKNILTKETKLLVIKDYLNYEIIKNIAKNFNISVGYINNILKEFNIKRIYDLKRRENARKYEFNYNIFENIDTEEKSYWIGLLMADGSIGKNMITLCLKDDNLVESFKNFIGGDQPLKLKKNCAGVLNQTYVSVCSKKMVEDLSKCFIVENKTYRTCIPNCIKEELVRHFIRGYFDGDGCCYVRKNGRTGSFSIVSCSIGILKEIENILKNRHILRKDKDYIHFLKNKSNYGTLIIDNKLEFKLFGNYIYNNASLYLKRKYDKYISVISKPNKIKKINAKSKYFGVCINKCAYHKKWNSYIWYNKKHTHIGNFYTEKEAAIAYNNKILELNLPREMLNKIEE